MATDRSEKTQARAKAAKDFVTLAKKFNPKNIQKVVGWGIHEKLDGVRARWHNGQLLSRTGKPFPVPTEILQLLTACFGDMEVDGELCSPGSGFQKAVSVVRNGKSVLSDWRKHIEYHIFDVDAEGNYDFRMSSMQLRMGMRSALIKITKVIDPVKSLNQVMDIHDQVVAQGGEGLILRDHSQPYIRGRSGILLKVKVFSEDEAEVIGHQPGEGKFEGMLGALECRMPDGNEFKVGTGFDDDVRENPPAIGTTVTYSYFGLTDGGKPRHPSFKAERNYE